MKYGYARVSTEDQELGRQIAALTEARCDHLYEDKVSGAKASRPALDKMMADLKAGDIVVVQKLDRLGRSLKHLVFLIDEFERRGVRFISLGENFDTTTAMGRMVMQMVAVFAEFERKLISERTKNGLKHVRGQGVRLGRPSVPQTTKDAIRALRGSGAKIGALAAKFKISPKTVNRIIKAKCG